MMRDSGTPEVVFKRWGETCDHFDALIAYLHEKRSEEMQDSTTPPLLQNRHVSKRGYEWVRQTDGAASPAITRIPHLTPNQLTGQLTNLPPCHRNSSPFPPSAADPSDRADSESLGESWWIKLLIIIIQTSVICINEWLMRGQIEM